MSEVARTTATRSPRSRRAPAVRLTAKHHGTAPEEQVVKQRVQLDLTPAAVAEIDQLAALIGVPSRAQVIRFALGFLKSTWEAQHEHGERGPIRLMSARAFQ